MHKFIKHGMKAPKLWEQYMLEYGWNIMIANVGKHDISFHATHLNDHF
jgi:hypothetical protein